MRAGAMLGVLLVLATAACAGGGQPAGDPPAVHPSWQGCPEEPGDGQEALAMPRLGDDFTPVVVIACTTREEKRAGGGTALVLAEERSDDVAAVVAALRLPDEQENNGTEVVCPGALILAPWLALLDNEGRWVRPGVPVNSCGQPHQDVIAAYRALELRTVSTSFLREMESDEAATAGCAQTHGDMVWVSGEQKSGRGPAPDLAPDEAAAKLCVYRVPADEQGNDKPAGQFESGGDLPAGRWADIKRELLAARPAAACGTPASRFAVLNGMSYVEADGCGRVLLADNLAPLQGSKALRELVFTK